MPPSKPTEAELAARATAATKSLKKLLASAAKAEAEAQNRSTGSRAKYKVGFTAAEEALRILLGRPETVRPRPVKTTEAARKPRRTVVDPVPARRVTGSATAKSNVVPIARAPRAPKKTTGRKVGGRARS